MAKLTDMFLWRLKMNLHNVEFIVSAVERKQYPKNKLPEIAMVGRSNVGKSSMINCILNRKNFARVSSKPGKTVTINFYNIDNKLNIADLPGYGYAKVSKQEKEKWGNMINEYLENENHASVIFLLVDSRHAPSEDDMMMLEWIRYSNRPFYVVATKVDKIKPSVKEETIKQCFLPLGIDKEQFIEFSSEKGTGKEDVIKIMEDLAENYC